MERKSCTSCSVSPAGTLFGTRPSFSRQLSASCAVVRQIARPLQSHRSGRTLPHVADHRDRTDPSYTRFAPPARDHRRYAIVSESDLAEAARRLDSATGTISGTI